MDRLFDWLMLALVVAALFLFVRPKSLGPTLVGKVSDGVIGVIRSVTGGGTWASA